MKVTSSKFIATHDHGEVSALLVLPENATALLVLAHGAGTNMQHRSMEQLSEGLAERGIATFRYNFPYKEKPGGGGPNKPDVLIATVRAAVAAATKAAGDLPLFAGGKSLGGRMSSMAASEEPLPNVKGIVFFAFPLHPPGKPATSRAEHLFEVTVPMLFLQGPRDELATPELLDPIVKNLGKLATLHMVEGADHSFNVLKRSGRTDAQALAEVMDTAASWIKQRI